MLYYEVIHYYTDEVYQPIPEYINDYLERADQIRSQIYELNTIKTYNSPIFESITNQLKDLIQELGKEYSELRGGKELLKIMERFERFRGLFRLTHEKYG